MKTKSNTSIHHRTLLHIVLFLCVAVVCQGCGPKSSGSAGGSGKKKLRIVFVANTPDDYWSVVRLGCDSATRAIGDVDLDFRFPATPTAASQEELINSVVAEGVDGIAVSPIDPESQTEFLNGIAAKTLLVCVDSDAAASKRACYIGIDNVAAGARAAQLLKAALPQGGKIVIFASYLNAQNIKDRIQGLTNGLSGSNIQVLDTIADGGKIDLAQKNAGDVLAKNPDLAGMECLNGYQGPAVLTAVRGAGKAGQVKIVSFEDSSDTLDGVESGDIFATLVQPPFNTGFQTITRMEKYLGGDKTQLPAENVLLPVTSVTKDKVAGFRDWRKTMLLKPNEKN